LLELRCKKDQSLELKMSEEENVERVDEQIFVKIVRLVIRELIVLSQVVKEKKLN
jgi:hypothetical protein